MVRDGVSGLDGAHHLPEGLRRGVDERSNTQRGLGRQAVERDQLLRSKEGLVDRDIRTRRVLLVPLVGLGIAADHDLHALPLQREADRAVTGVDRRPGADGHAVLLVDDRVFTLVVELVDDDLARLGREGRQPSHVVPVVRLHEVLERVLGSHFHPGAAQPPDLHGDRPSRRPATGPEAGKVTPVVRVQM